MKTKTCFKCNIKKSFDEYYKHSKMSDGILGKCISCTKNDTKTRIDKLILNPEWAEKEKKRNREKALRLGYAKKYKPSKESKALAIKRYKERFPEIAKCRNKMNNKKALIKGNNLHHWSYNEIHFLDTIELSVEDHNKLHRYIIYDQERRMYRTIEGILLDTKKAHEDYFNEIKYKY